MKPIYWDYTPRWVPFTAAAMIVIGVWIGGIWDSFEFADVTRFAVGLACVLFVLIFFQGRFFWKNQVDRLSTNDGEYYEALTSIWVGRGKRIAFGPQEATGWESSAAATQKDGQPRKLGTISFMVKGQRLEMSFLNPRLVDLQALSALNPDYFAKVKADYPALASVGG